MTIWNQIQQGIILAPSYMHTMLQYDCMQQQKAMTRISIQSISMFLQKFQVEQIEELDIIYACKEAVQEIQLHTYANICQQYDFLKQCYDFIQEMILYQIDPIDLPKQSHSQQELYAIISHLYPIVKQSFSLHEQLSQLSEEDVKNVYILDPYPSFKSTIIYQKLIALGAQVFTFKCKCNHSSFYHAMNKRKEVEVFAQYMIQEQLKAEEIQIFVCDPSYKRLIQQIFSFYEIPSTILQTSKKSSFVACIQAFISYYINPTQHNLFALLDVYRCKCFQVEDLKQYLSIFEYSIFDTLNHVEQNAKVSELISNHDVQKLLQLEQKAKQAQKQILPSLQLLFEQKKLQDVIDCIYTLTTTEYQHILMQQMQLVIKLQKLCMIVVKHANSIKDLQFLNEILDTMQLQEQSSSIEGVIVSDLKQPLPPRKYAIYFGCTQKAYPAFQVCDGLFDEAYVAKINNYPSLRERHEAYLEHLQQYLFTSEYLYVSYPIGTYQGKSNEPSLEMEQFLQKESIYQMPKEQIHEVKMQYCLSQEIAEKLYQKDGCLKGSVSAFERYQACHFSYFLRYGLGVKENVDTSIGANRIGTLVHYILETLTNQYQKQYVDADFIQVEQLLQQELFAFANLFPKIKLQLSNLQYRLKLILQHNFEFLKDMEQHCAIGPYASEHEFEKRIPLKDIDLHLHGFIDRLDCSSGYARIIDYKSSSKSLVKEKIAAGLQLQLLTYAWYVKEAFPQQVLGTYYYSLKPENIVITAGKIDRRKKMFQYFGLADFKKAKQSKQRLNGWTFHEDASLLDTDGTHIVGFSCKGEQDIKINPIYQLDVICDLLKEIYQHISTHILQGDILCQPSEDACLFCKYHSICKFHGFFQKVQPIVEFETSEIKGVKENANLE